MKDAALEKPIERLAGRNLHDTRQDVHAPAILPDFAGLMGERQIAKARDELGEGIVGSETCAPIEPVDRLVDKLRRVNQARGVAKQIADRH